MDGVKGILGDTKETKQAVEDVLRVAQSGVSYEEYLGSVVPFFTEEERKQIEDAIPDMVKTWRTTDKYGKVTEHEIRGKFQVMSVSRQTDPVFFSKEIIRFLKRNSLKSLSDPTRVNAIEIWSKHDGIPMQDILDACIKYRVAPMISFSITTLGDTALEKGVMRYQDMLDRVRKLIDMGYLDPRTTTIRIDPIFPGVTDMKKIEDVVDQCVNMGIKKFVTSLMQSYDYTTGKKDDRHVVEGINEAFASEGKTYDWDKYYGRNKEGVIYHKPKQEYIKEIGSHLIEILNKHKDDHIKLETCAFIVDGLESSACLDPLILERLIGTDIIREDGTYEKDTSRPDCMCYACHTDMFRMNQKKCYSSCAYCYAGRSGDNPINYYTPEGELIDFEYTDVRPMPETHENSLPTRDTTITVKRSESLGISAVRPFSMEIYRQKKDGSATEENIRFASVEQAMVWDTLNMIAASLYEDIQTYSRTEDMSKYELAVAMADEVLRMGATPNPFDHIGKHMALHDYEGVNMDSYEEDMKVIREMYNSPAMWNNREAMLSEFLEESFRDSTTAVTDLIATGYAVLATPVSGIGGTYLSRIYSSELTKLREDYMREMEGRGKEEERTLQPVRNKPKSLLATLEERAEADMVFDPRTRRDRATMLAQLFMSEIKNLKTSKIKSLKKEIESAKAKNDLDRMHMLESQLDSIDDEAIIRQYSPRGIFDRVEMQMEAYAAGAVEHADYFDYYFDKYFISKGRNNHIHRVTNVKFSDQELFDFIDNKVETEKAEFQKIVDHFKVLAEEASMILTVTEGIIIIPFATTIEDAHIHDDMPSLGDKKKTDTSPENEEDFKDGWMTKYRMKSTEDSLSRKARRIIHTVKRMNQDGTLDMDDLGYARYLDGTYVNGVLNQMLDEMTSPEEMIPILEKNIKTKPWLRGLINLLKTDDEARTIMYTNYRKDLMTYEVVVKEGNAKKGFKYKVSPANKPTSAAYLLEQWNDNFESGNMLDKYSLYDSNGNLVLSNIQKLDELLIDIHARGHVEYVKGQKYSFKDENGKTARIWTTPFIHAKNYIMNEDVFQAAMKGLRMVGIDIEEHILRDIIQDTSVNTDIRDQHKLGKNINGYMNLKYILDKLQFIANTFRQLYSPENTASAEGVTLMINQKASLTGIVPAYTQLANFFKDIVNEGVIESSATEAGTTYYAHNDPNYTNKIVKRLKKAAKGDKAAREWVMREYGKDEWFYEDGKWRNYILREIMENERDISHKVDLVFDRKKYAELTELEYTIMLYTEYKKGWIPMPAYSDTDAAEFIKVPTLSNEQVIDEFIGLINQEYDRIMFVRRRGEKIKNGDSSIRPIARYDIKYNKDGSIRDLGGAEFKFLPELNSMYDKETNEYFIDTVERLVNEGNGDLLKTYLTNTIKNILEARFEEAMRKWYKMGLFEETDRHSYKYIDIDNDIAEIEDWLHKAKSLLDTQDMFDDKMRLFLFDTTHYRNLDAKNIEFMVKSIRSTLAEFEEKHSDKLTPQQMQLLNYVKNEILNPRVSYEGFLYKMKKWFYNSTFLTSQIIQLYVSDLAFFGGVDDFQKRFKGTYSPANKLDTTAKWNGELVGREYERTIYLKDDEIMSSIFNEVAAIYNAMVERGEMTKLERDSILSKFRNTNVADAQAYRSLSSYRAVLVMSGRWSNQMEESYKNITKGTATAQDYNTFYQVLKPLAFGNTYVESGIEGHSPIRVPYMHKNSEFPLMAMYSIAALSLGKSEKLRALNHFMERFQIDVVQFESSTKIGKQGVIDLNGVDDYDDVWDILDETTYVDEWGDADPNVVHTIPYEDYGIQQENPEHVIDKVQLIGTQIRQHITANMPDSTIVTIGNKTMTKKEWMNLFNAVNTENIIDSFVEVDEMFQDPLQIEYALKEEILKNPIYGYDMLHACSLNEDGYFNIPLFDPIQTKRIQSMLNSIIRNRITKQRIKGGALTQVSCYGLTDQLNIVFKDRDGNLLNFEDFKKKHRNIILDEEILRIKYERFVDEAMKSGELAIAYFETYMPAYSRQFYEGCIDPETGLLDANKLPEELRYAVGYRIPTQDKNSMVPIYIKGFLPANCGSSIMLPAEITTISGSDFDIDKMYIMLPEFRVVRYDMKKAWRAFENEGYRDLSMKTMESFEKEFSEKSKEEIEELFNDNLEENGIEEAPVEFKEWFKENGDRFKLETPKYKKIRYDYKKKASENSRAARNNLIIDLMFGALTTPEAAKQLLTPNTADYVKKASSIVEVLRSVGAKELRQLLLDGGVKFDKTIIRNEKEMPMPLSMYLFELPLKLDSEEKARLKEQGKPFLDIDTLASSAKVQLNPLTPTTRTIIQNRNMAGIAVIPICTSQLAAHSVCQQSSLELNKYGWFKLNGKTLTNLHRIQNDEGEYISANCNNFATAAVDNGKDPMLGSLNIYEDLTAGVAMMLTRLGYNPIEVGLLTSQPIVVEMVEKCRIYSREGQSTYSVITNILQNYKELAHIDQKYKLEYIQEIDFFADQLADNIMMGERVSSLDDDLQLKFYKSQYFVGMLFKHLVNTSEALLSVDRTLNYDTTSNSAGTSLAETLENINRVESLYEKVMTRQKFPLSGALIMDDTIDYEGDIDLLREQLLNSKIPIQQAFYTCGVKLTARMFDQYFPHLKPAFRAIVDEIRHMTKYDRLDVKTINSIFNDLMAYILTKTSFFGGRYEVNEETGETIYATAEQRRHLFIKGYPKHFKSVLQQHPDIANIDFMKKLSVINPNKACPLETLIFRNVVKLTPIQRDQVSRDWSGMLSMENPEAHDTAMEMCLYNFFRTGADFGRNSFAHLTPLMIRMAIPEYVKTLNSMLTTTDTFEGFVEQYVCNHTDNKNIMPEMPNDTSFKFGDEEVAVTIHRDSSDSDIAVCKSVVETQYGPLCEFFPYIQITIDKKQAYYKLDKESMGTNEAIYYRINPLGYRNNFLEYEYGRSAETMVSAIKSNDRSYDVRAGKKAKLRQDAEEYKKDQAAMEKADKGYSAQYQTSNADPAQAAMNKVYGKDSGDIVEEKKDYSPNENHKDANDEEICGTGGRSSVKITGKGTIPLPF